MVAEMFASHHRKPGDASVRWRGARLAAAIALPPALVAFGLALSEVLTAARPDTTYWPPRGLLWTAAGTAALVVASTLGWWLADRIDLFDLAYGFALFTVVGIITVGLPTLLVTFLCATVWVWAMRREGVKERTARTASEGARR